ncbi:hypothetical protein HID58_018276 [Brassica napus]|uniref:Uncharacterized protein n=1 Tax=Brassica napus TaxID=3708 RepID=A0ABQ8DBZ0_BRANA|nr:hypothetical protein HID58_018276 [Brassica napus]
MNSPRVPGTTAAPPPMPPGATGPASNHAASSSRSNSYPQMTLNAMLNSPARLAQPHLHPDKINGALLFGIDPCVNSFIRATWQAYYVGPWKSWRKLPDERRESWWQTFVTRSWKRNISHLSLLKLFYVMFNKILRLRGGMFMDSAVPNTGSKAPSSCVPNGLALNLELEMRVGGLETSLQSVRQDVSEVKQDVSEMKQDFASTRDEINQLLQTLRPQQAPAEQTSAQPQAPSTQP